MNGFVDLDAVTRDAESVWAADDSVRAEFGSKDVYLAFRWAEAKGLSRAVGRGVTAFVKLPVQTPAPGGVDADWEGNSDLRAEFGGDKDAYLALCRAEQDGRVKILAPGATPTQRLPATLPQTAGELAGKSNQDAAALAERQSQIRQQNVGRQFAGLPVLPIPQE